MGWEDSPDPAVTVVVIVHNDASRLPTAVASVLRQTLRAVEVVIVDDASTDATPEVAAALSDQHPNVRWLRHDTNSGGCGRPRNTGTEAARAPHVMFLDSDDRLERHACKNLLEALEDSGADLSMGLVRRVDMRTRRQTRWYAPIFAERRVLRGLADEPRLIEEVLAVNKLYRRAFLDEWGIRFPEDVHYEDQLFTLQVYHRAKAIAVIPETVYYWRIHPPTAVRSITQQRGEIENFRHRLAVHRRMDDYIREHATPELQRLKDVKFLTNDMRLYLADAIIDDSVISQVLALGEGYLRAMPEDRFEAMPAALRVAYGMALRADVEGLRQAMLWDRHHVLALSVQRHGDEVRVARRGRPATPDPAWPAAAPENRFLAVDESVPSAPVGAYNLLHELTDVVEGSGSLTVLGRTYDTLGKLGASGHDWSFSLRLRCEAPGGHESRFVPLHPTSVSDDVTRWSAGIPLQELALLERSSTWSISVRARVAAYTRLSPLVWGQGVPARRTVPPLARATGQSIEVGASPTGVPEIRVTSTPAFGGKVANRVRKRWLPAVRRRVGESVEDVHGQGVSARAYAALRRMPLRRDVVVYEANMGSIYGDSPKYVYEHMRRARPDLRAVWVLPPGHEAPADDVEVVHRGTVGYLRALSRAAYWVDNQGFPHYVRKRPDQRYLQTWHGIPLKKMGRDVLGVTLPPLRPDRGIGSWDELVVPSDYFEKVFLGAFDYVGSLVRGGTPRNDVLVDGSLTTSAARRLLDLPDGAPVVLYAPTFRERDSSGRKWSEVLFDVERLMTRLPPETFLLLRPHYLNRISVPDAWRYRAIDVSSVEDVNVLYLASDVLVTDYSSVMFDFALLDRPMVFHTPDLHEYLTVRGTYLDVAGVAPGPLTATTEELADAVTAALVDPHSQETERRRFVDAYCGLEDGHASARALSALLGPSGGTS